MIRKRTVGQLSRNHQSSEKVKDSQVQTAVLRECNNEAPKKAQTKIFRKRITQMNVKELDKNQNVKWNRRGKIE